MPSRVKSEKIAMYRPGPGTHREQTELGKWQRAVEDARSTIVWMTRRGNAKTKRILALEEQIRELGGVPVVYSDR